jgi:hypothetical protein
LIVSQVVLRIFLEGVAQVRGVAGEEDGEISERSAFSFNGLTVRQR